VNRNKLIRLQRKIKDNKAVRAICWPIKTLINKLEEFRYSRGEDKKRMEKFRGKHEGTRCFIIGNGPSLTIRDLEALNGEITFASNRIYRLYDKTDWRPSYWVASDVEVLRNDKEQLLKVINTEGMICFITHFFREFGTGPNIYYYLMRHVMRIDRFRDYEIEFIEDATLGLGNGCTVTYIAIQLAVFMGCREIYLIGVDNNYSRTLIDGKIICNDEVKNYPDDMKVGRHEVFGEAQAYPVVTDHAYSVALDYCEAHGIRIANATRGGKLEVFERVALEDVLGNRRELLKHGMGIE
jgi:hypothetical protein